LEELPKDLLVNISLDSAGPEQHTVQVLPGKFQLWDRRVIANEIVIGIIELG
jgi:hypothetical protein